MLRMLVEQNRPDLAERLRRLREQSPEKFRAVLTEALATRLEAALDAAARSEGPVGANPARSDEAQQAALRRNEWEAQQQKLEDRSRELASKVRALRTAQPDSAEARAAREELVKTLNQQFDVRTALRRQELERLSQEIVRLTDGLERMKKDLEDREHERATIIDRRANELTGDDARRW